MSSSLIYRLTCVLLLCLALLVADSKAKIYERCELARELRDVHDFPAHQLSTWLCIANYESHFNTSAHNPGSGDHGIFQISELFWCSPPGTGDACGLSCADLKNDDIEDDAVCARRIFRQHQRISGDGFTAWVVYDRYCRNRAHADTFLKGCFTLAVKTTEPKPDTNSDTTPETIVGVDAAPLKTMPSALVLKSKSMRMTEKATTVTSSTVKPMLTIKKTTPKSKVNLKESQKLTKLGADSNNESKKVLTLKSRQGNLKLFADYSIKTTSYGFTLFKNT